MRIWLMILSLVVLAANPAAAQSDKAAYAAEAKRFNKMPSEIRLGAQALLAVAGYLRAPVTAPFDIADFEAVRRFQQDRGWPMTGVLTADQLNDLEELSAPVYGRLGFEKHGHPTEKRPIWVPVGLSLKPYEGKLGTLWTNDDKSIAFYYRYIPKASLEQLRQLEKQTAEEQNGTIRRDEAGKSSVEVATSFPDGRTTYTSWFKHKNGALGISMLWKDDVELKLMITAATLSNSSLAAAVASRPFLDPPALHADARAAIMAAYDAYLALPADARLNLQILLAASGHLKRPISETNALRATMAIAELQAEQGMLDSGLVDDEVLEILKEKAAPGLALWGFREMPHPTEGRPIWIPMGLGFDTSERNGTAVWISRETGVRIYYSYLPSQDLARAFDEERDVAREQKTKLEQEMLRRDSYVIRGQEKDGNIVLKVMHRHKEGILGFSAYWPAEDKQHMTQAALIMQASLAAAVEGKTFPTPPDAGSDPEEVAATPAPGDSENEPSGSSGTGFFISRDGHVLTNAHVVEGCSAITVRHEAGTGRPAELVARDEANDMALLKTSFTETEAVRLRTDARVGERVAAFGFPMTGTLSAAGNFTLGDVTALAGMRDDSRFLQISAPVQPGNSGGPLFDMAGNVVGIITAKLTAAKVAAAIGDIPENVNFAIKAQLAASFVEDNGVTLAPDRHDAHLAPADLAERARTFSTFIECQQ